MRDIYSKLAISIALIVIAITFLGFYIGKPKIYSKLDLIEVSGTVQDYKFIARKSFNRESYDYTISLSGYDKKFQIIADFVYNFDRSAFEQSIKLGDKLFIFIPKNHSHNILNRKRIKVFGIRNNTCEFLNTNASISEYNSQNILFGIVALMIMGIVGIFHYWDKLSKTKNKYGR